MRVYNYINNEYNMAKLPLMMFLYSANVNWTIKSKNECVCHSMFLKELTYILFNNVVTIINSSLLLYIL